MTNHTDTAPQYAGNFLSSSVKQTCTQKLKGLDIWGTIMTEKVIEAGLVI